ncbi:MAG: PQQ-binding-like beta-propeller repeat protein, partial [Pirellulales bacterium]|nr:PQQ-binding-like beta-propeller repeat protein [Pirellulales bacterium]
MNSSPSKTLADRQLAPVSLAIARFLCLGLGLLVAAPCAEHSLVASAVGQEQKKTSEKKIEQSDKKKQNDDKKDTGKDQGADKQDNEEEAATEESKEQVRNAFQQLGGMIQEAVAEAADEEPFVDEHFDGGITLDENRDLRRRFDIAKRQIEQGNVADTVKFLGEFLTDTDTKDFFLAPTSRGRMRQSFRAAVQQLIGSLPEDGKESYELLFGGRAQKLLEQAVADRNWNLLHDVVRGYYHTQAGGQALYLLGSHYLDLDRPREALVCLERLQELDQSQSMQPRLSALITAARYRTGDVEAAIQDVQQMRDTSPESLTLLATAPRSKPPTADQLADPNAIRAWLASMLGSPSTAGNSLTANWDTFRGGPSRNVKANASTPLLSSQAQHEIGSPYAIKSVSSYRKAMNSAKMAVLPMLHPVVIGENALISTDAGLSVRHLATGDTWSYPSASASVSLESHFWCSSAFGMPSTNGQLAFVVEGQADVAGMGSHGHEMLMMRQVGFRRGFGGPFFVGNHTGSTGGHLTNSLTAVDLASKGKRRWRVGGADGREEPLLAGAYFLGSPLPYGGRVYSVAEFKGSLRLLALNAETGKLEWNQELAIAESAISADMFRRMAGATPSVADGIIVCPTSCGGVVALDLTTQSLAWAYRYPRRRETISNQNHYYNNTSGTSLDQGDRWIDATAVISDGCVIITPM